VAAHPDVLDVVARAVRDRGEPQVAAYVTVVPDSTLDAAGLRGNLADRVPGHLIPAHVVVLAELPRTPGGKLDPRALPALPRPAAAAPASR
ncbi:hypothetical protein, partial [Streptomyces sp. NPDC091259]|uniref:AMP-binding enzyme n=1 Tax=Streptomyces sp. NPDC091259 TaxID=3365976 RepID=UPI0037FDDA0D